MVKKLKCYLFGHKLRMYIYRPSNSYNPDYGEWAGHCESCGYDTHEQEANHA